MPLESARSFLASTLLLLASGSASAADWEIDLDSPPPHAPLPTALLGHYDLSGQLFAYDQEAGLPAAMQAVGFSDWRVSVGRWEAGTWLLPTLSDEEVPCDRPITKSHAPAGATDATLIAARDWFSHDGNDVEPADTEDDARYQLAYLRSVLDVVDAFGATPFVSIDSMPLALSASETPLRADCSWTFMNQVTNVRPDDPQVFASAAAGLVERIVEGDAQGAARPVQYWEVWNEPEFPQFWDPAFEPGPGPLDHFFAMATATLAALDAYRAGSAHPNAANLRFGLASFGTAGVTAATLNGFDDVPGGPVPLDFISFHAYSDDPLDVANVIAAVAQAADGTDHYGDIELALAEWGPNLAGSAGDPVYAASMEAALHPATVLALGAASGLDRAHRAIFFDFYAIGIELGILDNAGNPKPAYRAYELLAKVITPGALRIAPVDLPDGRLDAGLGAVLASRDPAGTTRVLFVNRNATARTAKVRLEGGPRIPSRLFRYDDPTGPVIEEAATGATLTLPGESMLVAEFDAPGVPALGAAALGLLTLFLVAGVLAWRVGTRELARHRIEVAAR